MENKGQHIDQFINEKLKDLESIPDSKSFEAIMHYCEHTEHPIDFAINKTLSNIEPSIDSIDISLERLVSDSAIIDLSINRHLHHLEDQQSIEQTFSAFETDKKRSKRALFLWFVFFMVVFTASYWMYTGSQKTIQQNQALVSETTHPIQSNENSNIENYSNNHFSNETKVANQTITKQTNQAEDSKSKRPIFNRPDYGLKSTINGDIIEDHKKESIKNTIETDEGILDKRQTYLIPINPFLLTFEQNNHSKINKKLPSYFKSPFGLILNFNFLNEVQIHNQVEDKNIHKDAAGVIGSSFGRNKNGIGLGLQVSYRIRDKIQVQTGLSYSTSNSKSTIDYFHTDIPVYDSLGNLKGYFKRPPSAFNHVTGQVENTSKILSIPFSIYYQFYGNKKFSLFSGIGIQYDFKRTTQGIYYDFNQENLLIQSNKNSLIQPHILVGAYYSMNSIFSIGSTITLGYQQQEFVIHSIPFQRRELTPSLQIALKYTPLVKK